MAQSVSIFCAEPGGHRKGVAPLFSENPFAAEECFDMKKYKERKDKRKRAFRFPGGSFSSA
ncbi:hypothetical protein EDM56_01455 [Brevibacillus fluminis]|uniref:Uncharacterized protein n=1 Tax=Brevibacillus fluminis TaxID=511487 RepID=A0A3M8DYT1_9BACL|nr:hypothetical protein EDM56_01455 [Brevibacillus fluminis]